MIDALFYVFDNVLNGSAFVLLVDFSEDGKLGVQVCHWLIVLLANELVDEIYLPFASYFCGVARPQFSINAENILFQREQSLLNILLVWLIIPFAIRAEVMIIAQPLKQTLLTDWMPVLCYHLCEFTD